MSYAACLVPTSEQYREDPASPISIDPRHVTARVLRKVVQLATRIHENPDLELAKNPVQLMGDPN